MSELDSDFYDLVAARKSVKSTNRMCYNGFIGDKLSIITQDCRDVSEKTGLGIHLANADVRVRIAV
jgi:hypothetical protein